MANWSYRGIISVVPLPPAAGFLPVYNGFIFALVGTQKRAPLNGKKTVVCIKQRYPYRGEKEEKCSKSQWAM